MPARIDLDHVALAAADTAPALRFLTGVLGGTVMFGGQAIGFRPMQVWVGTPDATRGMAVELLEPWETDHDDFLARFVARHGAGPHHLTFKVPDLLEAVERVRAAGLTPVKLDLSDPQWKEAFLMPADAHGTVVQLAETHGYPGRAEHLAFVASHGADGNPRWWVEPEPHDGPPAALRRVVLETPDLDGALALFAELLEGSIDDADDATADLVWPGGARLRLERHAGRGGIDRLEVEGLAHEETVVGTRFVPAA